MRIAKNIVCGVLKTTVLVAAALPPLATAQDYYHGYAAHSQGNIQLTITPGFFGYVEGYAGDFMPFYDSISHDSIYGCEYPRGSRQMFGYGSLFVGAVVGSDTLVTYEEWSSSRLLTGGWRIRSSNPSLQYYSPDAKSDLDLECSFEDTVAYYTDIVFIPPVWNYGWHEPLGLIGSQRSMAWSGAMVDDFVLIEYHLRNRGHRSLSEVYVGFWNYVPGHTLGFAPTEYDDHLTGYLRDYPITDRCGYSDTLNLAYTMDNDGDPVNGRFPANSRRGAVGVELLGASVDTLRLGYTWFSWDAAATVDWGPRRRPSNEVPWRPFNPYFAWPGNDINMYYVLSHPDIAYGQLFAAVDNYGWMPPGPLAKTLASGWPVDWLYWFGPFQVEAGEEVSFTIAVVGGDNVHTDPYA